MELALETKESIAYRIIELHKELGACTPLRELAKEALQRGFWSAEIIDGAVIAWAHKRVRDAMRMDDPVTGVQYAVPIDKGSNPRWKQTELLTAEEANFVQSERVAALSVDWLKLCALHDFFVAKFGSAITEIPRLQ